MMKKRLEFVSVNINNMIPKKKSNKSYISSSGESTSEEEESSSEEESEEEEEDGPMYTLRARRETTSYKTVMKEYDQMIDEAIEVKKIMH